MLSPILHVEGAVRLGKATREVIGRLVRISMVNVWYFGVIIDQQQRRRDTNDGPFDSSTKLVAGLLIRSACSGAENFKM